MLKRNQDDLFFFWKLIACYTSNIEDSLKNMNTHCNQYVFSIWFYFSHIFYHIVLKALFLEINK